jgi:hypothetical protein
MTKYTCNGDWLLEYADGDLSAADSALAELHLADCSDCSREVATLRRSRELLSVYFSGAAAGGSAVHVRSLPSPRISWNSAALALSSLAATALLVSLMLFPPGDKEEKVTSIPLPAKGSVASPTLAAESVEEDVLAIISRETQIARLRMTSEILAKEPGMNDRHLAIEKYLAEAYGVTKVQKPFGM